MTEKAIASYEPMNLQDTMALGQTIVKSGFFSDARDASQAVVKVLAGRELGFGPVASMTGIYVVKGRVTLSANLIASAVKRSGVYNYRVKQHDGKVCEIEFFENGQSVGVSSFSMEDAKAAGLGGDNWHKYPRNMLFARAMSNGAKWYCPDVFGGPVYTPEELDVPVNGETGEMIDVTPTVAPAIEQAAQDVHSNGEHWIDKTIDGKKVRPRFWAWAKTDMSLTEDQVYAALDVQHIHDYTGTMQEARDKITAWVAAQADAEAAELEKAA